MYQETQQSVANLFLNPISFILSNRSKHELNSPTSIHPSGVLVLHFKHIMMLHSYSPPRFSDASHMTLRAACSLHTSAQSTHQPLPRHVVYFKTILEPFWYQAVYIHYRIISCTISIVSVSDSIASLIGLMLYPIVKVVPSFQSKVNIAIQIHSKLTHQATSVSHQYT